MTSMSPFPVLFIGHGNPMNAIEDNEHHRCWAALGQQLPRPAAVLCISAHWETRGTWVTGTDRPETIHDFYGFPKPLFDVRYLAPGDPALATRIAGMAAAGTIRVDPGRGLDHGAWSVLRAMYPAADIPVVQLSLDMTLSGAAHYALAKQLAPLRDENILILGSGNIVHNLGLFHFHSDEEPAWAVRFQMQVNGLIANRNHTALQNFGDLGADAAAAIPTAEHYLPVLYALAAQRDDDRAALLNDRIISAISMTSVLIETP
jgi:4,5-DOPA dioxygenase extradiol